MDFTTDIYSLGASTTVKFELFGTKWPTNKDVYFRAKQKEIIDQYAAARLFMKETDTDDWNHWFVDEYDEDTNIKFKLIFMSYFYETALMYYNIVVDLSWTICYIAAEYTCAQKGGRVCVSDMKSIEDAAELLRNVEKNVTAPTAATNPFKYLKVMNPDFSKAIDLIIEFWNTFMSTPIREKYNFCKHRGKPAYSEIETPHSERHMSFYLENRNTGEKFQRASDIRDIQYQFSLIEGIEELRKFDDEVLFPYIRDLLNELEMVIQPSPMV